MKWKDPEIFRPERFMNEDGKFNINEELYFFGFGRLIIIYIDMMIEKLT